jgi:Na+-driven multidrug efflux pump
VPGVIAAFGAATRLDFFINIAIFSFQNGLASFAGQNIGAGRLDRTRRGLRSALVMSFSVTVIMCATLYIFAEPIISIFGLTDAALAIGIEQMRFLTKFYWIFSCYLTLCGVLQGAGDTIMQSIATLSALGVRIAASYLLVYFGILGYSAAWEATPIGWAFAAIIAYTRYFTGGWKKKAVAGSLSKKG